MSESAVGEYTGDIIERLIDSYQRNMLSFFRAKSTEPQVSEITVATESLSMGTTEEVALASGVAPQQVPIHASMDLLASLGYGDATELRDTIYGE